MAFTSISNNAILRGLPETGCKDMEVKQHQDAGYVAVHFPDGHYRGVDDYGVVDDTKTGAGSGERFTKGEGNVLIAKRATGDYWFMVA